MKPTGEVRPCLVARDLNKAIIHENHKSQTVEETAHWSLGLWSLQRQMPSRPFYRYTSLRQVAREGTSIHDDIVIYGTCEEDYDANHINLLNVAQLEGLVLNSKKLELKWPRVSFFSAEYSADGMHPCPKKIQGITEMTPPIDKQQLASFIGMVINMGNFVPHVSHHTEPLRVMLKQHVVFHWDQMANDSFQKIKDLIAKTAYQSLRFYDRYYDSLSTSGRPAICLCQQEPHRH